MEKNVKKKKIYRDIYADLNQFVIHWTLTQHSIATILHLKRKHKMSNNYQKVPLSSTRFNVLHHLNATTNDTSELRFVTPDHYRESKLFASQCCVSFGVL